MDLRVAAYGVLVSSRGMLLAHWSERGRTGWTLPGGGIDPGEDPADAAVREIAEETGYEAVLDELLGVDSHILAAERTNGGRRPLHMIRIVYRAHVVGGSLRDEVGGTTDAAAWIPLEEIDDLDRISIVDIGRRLAGLPSPR